jgi:pimeloyl-ACP methyl ester carboxylesterase
MRSSFALFQILAVMLPKPPPGRSGASRRPRRPLVSTDDKVRVVVRVRPPKGPGEAVGLEVDAARNTVQGMVFDHVLGADRGTTDVFDCALPTIDAWLEGYNGCIFAYGQTGSGKTHTMLGPDGGKRDLDGVIPMTVKYALEHISAEQETSLRLDPDTLTSHRVRATYVEIYNNEVRDLLVGYAAGAKPTGAATPSDSEAVEPVNVREDATGRVFLTGAAEVTVKSPADLMALVRYGAQRRATGRTNMNEHSSRSHAVLTLHHQHRWKPADDVTGKLLKQTDAELHLVDLAGSEYAKRTGNTDARLKESAAINTGLFALGNVIAALAGHRDRRVGNHVPYRDSILTRLLQSSLGGDCRTVMLVCCSPAADDVTETLGSLRYAADARRIDASATKRVLTVQPEAQPLDNDLADPLVELDRRCIWLEVPGFDDVYCRCVGDPVEGELILLVHGSGPTNSSTWWNQWVWQLSVLSHRTPFYLVAIDCPGYGLSPGDRQIIRSLPGQFLTAVVNALGFRTALALVGSSQGAAAVFNATLENPSITRHVAVMDPVGHDVFRYKAIRQPCLLSFDVEDAGHPVKVGRWMRDNLPRCVYHEFAASEQPCWNSDHFAPELIKMIDGSGWDAPRSGGGAAALAVASRISQSVANGLQRLAGGLVAWCEPRGTQGGEAMKEVQTGLLLPPSDFIFDELGEDMVRQLTLSDAASTFASDEAKDAEGAEWVAAIDPKQHRIYYTNQATLEVMWRRPRHGVVVQEAPTADVSDDDGAAIAAPAAPRRRTDKRKTTDRSDLAAAPAGGGTRPTLFDDEDDGAEEAKPPAPTAQELADLAAARAMAEIAQDDCECCGEALDAAAPRRFTVCRHIVCVLCYLRTAAVTSLCPVCHPILATVPLGKAKAASLCVPQDDSEHQRLLERLGSSERALNRRELIAADVQLRKSSPRVVLEYGNTATGSQGAAMTVQAFMRIASTTKGGGASGVQQPGGRGAKAAASAAPLAAPSIDCVAFNINPDFPKSAVKVRAAPFTLERTMSTRFTCEMIVTFNNKCGIPPIAVPYCVMHEPLTLRRVAVYNIGATLAEEATNRKAMATQKSVDVETTIEIFV